VRHVASWILVLLNTFASYWVVGVVPHVVGKRHLLRTLLQGTARHPCMHDLNPFRLFLHCCSACCAPFVFSVGPPEGECAARHVCTYVVRRSLRAFRYSRQPHLTPKLRSRTFKKCRHMDRCMHHQGMRTQAQQESMQLAFQSRILLRLQQCRWFTCRGQQAGLSAAWCRSSCLSRRCYASGLAVRVLWRG
jgi:hypothetical protein